MSDDTQQPIIVKKIKKGGGGAHGGAWKIAYADFVTAMMAFFLLMWLLGSTAEGDLKGIAEFFNSPLKVAMSGGSGAGDATSPIVGGGQDLTRSVGQVKRGDVDGKRSLNIEAAKGAPKASGDEGAADAAKKAERAQGARQARRTEGADRGDHRSQSQFATIQEPVAARYHDGRLAHPDRGRAEPSDVRCGPIPRSCCVLSA
jgi:flagellar motor protein MotB